MPYCCYYYAGYYCDFGVQPIADYTTYPCPAGYYCPAATEFDTQYGCSPGSYSATTQLSSDSQCTPCPAGKYCIGAETTFTGE